MLWLLEFNLKCGKDSVYIHNCPLQPFSQFVLIFYTSVVGPLNDRFLRQILFTLRVFPTNLLRITEEIFFSHFIMASAR